MCSRFRLTVFHLLWWSIFSCWQKKKTFPVNKIGLKFWINFWNIFSVKQQNFCLIHLFVTYRLLLSMRKHTFSWRKWMYSKSMRNQNWNSKTTAPQWIRHSITSQQWAINVDRSEFLAPAGTQSVWVMSKLLEVCTVFHAWHGALFLSSVEWTHLFVIFHFSVASLHSEQWTHTQKRKKNMLPDRNANKTKKDTTINVIVYQYDLWWCCVLARTNVHAVRLWKTATPTQGDVRGKTKQGKMKFRKWI